MLGKQKVVKGLITACELHAPTSLAVVLDNTVLGSQLCKWLLKQILIMMKQYRGTHCGKESMLLMSTDSVYYCNASSTFLSTLTVALVTG